MAEKESSTKLNTIQKVGEDSTVPKVFDGTQTFTLFPKLAAELRIKVWHEALHLEEVLIIVFTSPDGLQVTGLQGRFSVGKAHLMAVNREARFEAQKVLRLFRGGALFNPVTDVALFSEIPSYSEWPFSDIVDRHSVQLNAADEVQRVGIEPEFLDLSTWKVGTLDFGDICPDIAHVGRGEQRELVILLNSLSLSTNIAYGVCALIKAQDKYRGVSGWGTGEFESCEVLGEKLLARLKEFQALNVAQLPRNYDMDYVNDMILPSKITFREIASCKELAYKR